jgi:hypothetical protein
MEACVNPEPIERYLDDLFNHLTGTGGAGRRALSEAEDHLLAATAEGQAAGLSEVEAAKRAVARFGDPARVATGLRVVHGGIWGALKPVFSGAWLLASIGMIAIGFSGLVAELMGRLISPNFVAGDPSGVTYTPDRCADYFEYFPHAASCANAAELHHWGEVVEYRVAAGVLGLLGLAAYALARRFGWLSRPPAGPLALVTTAVFGLAAVFLTLPPVMEMVFGATSGVGANLSGGIVALLLAAFAAVVALNRARATR